MIKEPRVLREFSLKSYMKCIKCHFNSKRKVSSSDALLPGTGIETYTGSRLPKILFSSRRFSLKIQETTVSVDSSKNLISNERFGQYLCPFLFCPGVVSGVILLTTPKN